MLRSEKLTRLSDAADLFPGPHPSRQLLCRWQSKGVSTGTQRITLETIKIGGLRYTSAEAVERFLDAINGTGEAPQ